MLKIVWKNRTFNQLTTDQLYDLLKFRVDIFVVEQHCPYPELDDRDKLSGAHHLTGYDQSASIIASARLLPPGVSYDNDVCIGRFAIASDMRTQGLGSLLLQQCLEEIEKLWPNKAIRVSAQEHLQKFYEKADFKRVSETYLEDDIPHIEMLRTQGTHD